MSEGLVKSQLGRREKKALKVNKRSNGKWTRIEDVFPSENGDIPLLC